MTREQRLALISFCENGIEQLKQKLEQSQKTEEMFNEFMSKQKSGNMQLAVFKSFLNPIQNGINELRKEISLHEKQLKNLENPEIEKMSDEDAIKYINQE